MEKRKYLTIGCPIYCKHQNAGHMTQTPPTVTDELSARLLEALGPAALVELTAFTALANLYTRTNTAIGIESQGFSAACDLKPLAVPSTT